MPCILHCNTCNYTGPLKGKLDIFNKPFEFNPSGDFLVIGCLFIILVPALKIMTVMHLHFNFSFNSVDFFFALFY